MAIIRFECTVCKREIELPEKKGGLEIISRCIITDGCRGFMNRIEKKDDFIRGEFPPAVNGLADWSPRRILYNHTQTIAATEWRIVHNLGVFPSVQVLVEKSIIIGDITEIPCESRGETGGTILVEDTPASIEIINRNEILIRFDELQSGIAQLIARSSALDIEDDVIEEESSIIQLTNTEISDNPTFEAELTIATLNEKINPVVPVNVGLEYISPSANISHTYQNIGSASVTSPWTDFGEITIRGRFYTVRSFSALISEMRNGIIQNGSSFYFTSLTDGTTTITNFAQNDMLILLAKDPYANVDKILDSFIDISDVDATNSELSFFYDTRELFGFKTLQRSVFPHIKEI